MFCNEEFNKFCSENGITRHRIVRYTPQQNGVAERRNRTLMGMVRSLISRSKLLGFMWGLLAITTTASIVAVARGIRRANRSEGMTNGIPARRITYTTYGITALILLLTFVFGSTQTMMVNGENFTDSFWLRITDMFVNSSLLLLVLAAGVVAFGATRYYRKGRGK